MTARSFLCLLLLGASAGAQENENFPRVYLWETPQEGWVEATLWTTFVGKSDVPYGHFGLTRDRSGLVAHSLELEYGLTDRLSVAAYGDFDQPGGDRFSFTGARLEARYRLFDRYTRWLNPALYFELAFPRKSYGEMEVEARLILEKDFGDFRAALNPMVAKSFSGEDASLSFAAGVYWRRYWRLQPGLELFAATGPIGNAPSYSNQAWLLSPSVDVRLTPRWVWHLAAGIGVSSAADRFTVRSLLSYELPTVRPSDAQR